MQYEIRDDLKLIRVAALTSGEDSPSSRFRVRQYIRSLADKGVVLRECMPRFRQSIKLPSPLNKVRRRYLGPWIIIQLIINILCRVSSYPIVKSSQLVLINRSFIPGIDELICIFIRNKKKILDVDDAIWLSGLRAKKCCKYLAENVDAVIVGNQYLANWFMQFNSNIYVVPTAVDTDLYMPRALVRNHTDKSIVIGWLGTSSNFSNLELVRCVLEQVVGCRDDVKVRIVSDRRPDNWNFDHSSISFSKWAEGQEVSDLQSFDIGIMPLMEDEWTIAKCSYKMLLYLAVGIPVVVSPVGMNNEILKRADVGYAAVTNEEWCAALSRLCDDLSDRRAKGARGREVVERYYSVKVVSGILNRIFRETLHGF